MRTEESLASPGKGVKVGQDKACLREIICTFAYPACLYPPSLTAHSVLPTSWQSHSLALLGPVISLPFPNPACQPRLGRGLHLRLGCCPESSLCCTCIPDATSCAPWSFPALGLKQKRLEGTGEEDLSFSTQGAHIQPGSVLGGQSKVGVRGKTKALGAAQLSPSSVTGGLGEKKPQKCR